MGIDGPRTLPAVFHATSARTVGLAANHWRHNCSFGARGAGRRSFGPVVLDVREDDAEDRRRSRSRRGSHRARAQRDDALLRGRSTYPAGRQAVPEALPLYVHDQWRPRARRRVPRTCSRKTAVPDQRRSLDRGFDAVIAAAVTRANPHALRADSACVSRTRASSRPALPNPKRQAKLWLHLKAKRRPAVRQSVRNPRLEDLVTRRAQAVIR